MIYLRTVPVGAMLSPPMLSVVASYLKERSFEQGEMVMREGEPVEGMYFLLEGGLQLSHGGRATGELRPPQTIGFLAIVAQASGTADAVAIAPTKTLELPADALLELFEDHFELLQATLTYYCERLLYDLSELPAAALAEFLADEVGPAPAGALSWPERILFLRGMRGFRRANLTALTALSDRLAERSARPGELLWSRGDAAGRLIVPIAGRLVLTGESGAAEVGPGGVLGAIESIADVPHFYSAAAAEPTRYLDGGVDALVDVFEDNPRMGLEFTSALAGDLLRALALKRELGLETVAQLRSVTRLGSVLLGS
jgi:CRP-like cAMP-binding protein